MSKQSRKPEVFNRDEYLSSMKQNIQEQSRQEVARGNLVQSDLFLIRPEVAKKAIVALKA
ncbi:hypothetical protein [uncultured Massilia sp.]|uniref:hypothetical protein n=1 Tax=uncultured Massilia sp. TaxID=169973 RepID=UPI0025D89E6E|nr:hypothetical protein [uncultured Massilia sp.]